MVYYLRMLTQIYIVNLMIIVNSKINYISGDSLFEAGSFNLVQQGQFLTQTNLRIVFYLSKYLT